MAVFKHEAKYQLAVFIGPGLLALWGGFFLPHFGTLGAIAVSIAAIGFGFILKAKLSEKRRTQKLLGWGSSEMTTKEKASYFVGYALILFYFVLSIYLSLNPILESASS